MTAQQIETLIEQRNVPEKTNTLRLVETHISWVLLTDQFAYKIKKPLQFSFLDFSTLDARKYSCERELILNQRLTSGVYLNVLPVRQYNSAIKIDGEADGRIIDYTVQMKRLDANRQMHTLLESNKIEAIQIKQLAIQLADFHNKTNIIKAPFDLQDLNEKFIDILKIGDFVKKNWGANSQEILETAVQLSTQFLEKNTQRFQERSAQGFVIDGHGDLHSGNIFLLDEPVIFDCIEFNDSFRYVDMLDEIAFLCLDFDFYNRPDLEHLFLKEYFQRMPCIQNETDQKIFLYYKLYRANVRLKVTCLGAMQNNSADQDLSIAQRYLQLLKTYCNNLLIVDRV
ncbi:MAG: hypothetical protein SFU99_09040 [Saprospiraceae bacterium]|nr:hypothetical protein [Saprospiraceae bacterium]